MRTYPVPFNRFVFDIPADAVNDCSHSGDCYADVTAWLPNIPEWPDPADIRAELREYGAWNAAELADENENRARLLWIAAGNASENIAQLENIRGSLRAENISFAQLAELESMVDYIDPGDVELLEAAGVPEFPEA